MICAAFTASCISNTANLDEQNLEIYENSEGVSNPDKPNIRSYISISRVMDRNKQDVYAIFNRYYRRDTLLEGKIVFELTIAPSGNVNSIRTISSELSNTNLVDELSKLIATFKFGAGDVKEFVAVFPIDFLPHLVRN